MTIYVQQGPAVGQPMSPFFGAQNGLGATPVIQQPTTAPTAGGMQATGVQMPMLEACSRGLWPRNINIASVQGVSTGAQNPTPIDDLMGNGAGNQVNLGVAISGVAGNPAIIAGTNNQQFVDGTGAVAQSANGPTPTSTESLTSGPVSGATTTANVAFTANSFAG